MTTHVVAVSPAPNTQWGRDCDSTRARGTP